MIGAVAGAMTMLVLFIPISLWAGWPRQRERRLERELVEARAGKVDEPQMSRNTKRFLFWFGVMLAIFMVVVGIEAFRKRETFNYYIENPDREKCLTLKARAGATIDLLEGYLWHSKRLKRLTKDVGGQLKAMREFVDIVNCDR